MQIEERGGVAETRSGVVALVGRPNAGKSTLLNALLGEKLSIVTARPQTTRDAVRGIMTAGHSQIVFVDTPGLLEPRYLLQRSMHQAASAALADADVALLLLDATRPGEVPPEDATAMLRAKSGALVVAISKIDAGRSDALRAHEMWAGRELGCGALYISALQRQGLPVLLDQLQARLPAGPFHYPEDDLAVQPVRFFVAELIRETVFEMYEQEVPYATAVRIEEYREDDDPVYIRAVIYVERSSQKGILIGAGGARLKELGVRARAKVEEFTGSRVFLDLWVKTLAGWRRKADALKYLGYPVPSETGEIR